VGSRDHHETISREAGTSALIDIILRRSAVSVLPQSRTLSEKLPHGARKLIVKPAYSYRACRPARSEVAGARPRPQSVWRHHAAVRRIVGRLVISSRDHHVMKPSSRHPMLHQTRRRPRCLIGTEPSWGSASAPGRPSSIRDRVPASGRPRPACRLVARRL